MTGKRWTPSVGGLIWVGVWTFPLLEPLSTVTATPRGVVAGVALGLFTLVYLVTTARGFEDQEPGRVKDVGFGFVAALGVALPAVLGEHWLTLLLFVSTCGMALYAGRDRLWTAAGILGSVLAAILTVGLLHDMDMVTVVGTMVGTVLSSVLVGSVRQMSRLIRELHRTREALAATAVVEERLRFSRDLHDLLGHTLSVIVVKAEVVRRLAERDPSAAAAQAADIEDIGRRALVEIREAVTGYRETGLTAELARAKGMLSSAGITTTVLRTADPLPDDADRLLAWVVREAATNVVRHSAAERCDIEITTVDGAAAVTVTDDGAAARTTAGSAGTVAEVAFGNGLRGLTERLRDAGGTLEVGTRDGGGFLVVARIPL